MQDGKKYLADKFYGGNQSDLKTDLHYRQTKEINWADVDLQARCNPERYGKAMHFIKVSLGYLPDLPICLPHLPFIQTLVDNVFKEIIDADFFTEEMIFHSKRIRNDDMKKNGWVKKMAYSKEEYDFYHSFLPEHIKPARERLATLMSYEPAVEHSLEAEIDLRQHFRDDLLFGESSYSSVDHRAVAIVRYREYFLLEGEDAADNSEVLGLRWASIVMGDM